MKRSSPIARIILTSWAVVLLATSLPSCAPNQSGGGGSAAPAPAEGPIARGTVSGGGGNGCEGNKVFETYARDIGSKEEFRLYVSPVLRRLREQGGDLLVSYMRWAATQKSWFFVPCELEKLSTEQIGVAIRSDQLARHGLHNVYIYSREDDLKIKSYANSSLRVRADLLLHEMVMGALLLMKRPLADQCEALRLGADTKLCRGEALAEGTKAKKLAATADKSIDVVTAEEHEAVRALTAHLKNSRSDFSADAIRALRKRLGFISPFDSMLSRLKFEDVANAITRSKLLRTEWYVTQGQSHFVDRGNVLNASKAVRCFANLISASSQSAYFDLEFLLPGYTGNAGVVFESGASPRLRTGCRNFANPYSEEYVMGAVGPECESAIFYDIGFGLAEFSDDKMVSTTKDVGGTLYDEVEIGRFGRSCGLDGECRNRVITKLLITREESPTIQSIRLEPKQVMKALGKNDAEPELLDIPGVPAIQCDRQ